jgi:hypothetical protein
MGRTNVCPVDHNSWDTSVADLKLSGQVCERGMLSSMSQIPERNKVKAERFILAHGFRAFNPWSAVSIAVGLW